MVKHIAYDNGSIRTPEGKLVAFFVKEDGVLHIDGIVQEFKVTDLDHAMELVGQHVK